MARTDHSEVRFSRVERGWAVRRVQIKLDTANALKWLGRLYRTPADAIKEHVTNAIDEYLKGLLQNLIQAA